MRPERRRRKPVGLPTQPGRETPLGDDWPNARQPPRRPNQFASWPQHNILRIPASKIEGNPSTRSGDPYCLPSQRERVGAMAVLQRDVAEYQIDRVVG